MTNDERRELAELYAADDRLRAGHADWMARREAAAASPVQRSNAEGVLYRMGPENAPAPRPQPVPVPSEGEYPPLDTLVRSLGATTAQYVAKKLAERDRKIERLEAKLDAALTMLGNPQRVADSKSADVVELPRGFLRRVRNG